MLDLCAERESRPMDSGGAFPLLKLPESCINKIAKHASPGQHARGHPLLAVARDARNAVLRSASKISLNLDKEPTSSYQATSRLLNRVCREAPPGLQIKLDLQKADDALPCLLQPALGAWHSVRKLEVHIKSALYLNLIGLAMPCLEQLSLHMHGASLSDCALLTGLQQCTQLSVLGINNFVIPAAAVRPAGSALANLKALKGLTLAADQKNDTNPAGLLAQLAGLTALCIESSSAEHTRDMVVAAANNPGLKVLSVASYAATPSTAEWSHLLTSCRQLETLELGYAEVPQPVLDVLLTLGTNITSLDTSTITVTTSFALSPCKWRRLRLWHEDAGSLFQLAYLPLHSVTHLDVGLLGFPLPLEVISPEQLPRLVLQAAVNTLGCPAWQAAPANYLSFWTAGSPPETVSFTPEQRIPLLEALKPLGGPHITKFGAYTHDTDFEWGRPELQALAHSMNSGQLSELELYDCTLTTDFWAALDELVPSLSSLVLNGVTLSAFDLAVFCSRRRQRRTLCIRLDSQLYQAINGAQLQASLEGHGVVNVQIVKWL